MKCLDLKFYVPAKNYELSQRFYKELGFTKNWEAGDVTEFERDGHRFLLQNFYVKEHAENCVVHLLVDDVQAWFEHVRSVLSKSQFPQATCTEPKDQPWGIITSFLKDPSGVLWHIGQRC